MGQQAVSTLKAGGAECEILAKADNARPYLNGKGGSKDLLGVSPSKTLTQMMWKQFSVSLGIVLSF